MCVKVKVHVCMLLDMCVLDTCVHKRLSVVYMQSTQVSACVRL